MYTSNDNRHTSRPPVRDAKQQLQVFLDAMFQGQDLVETRLICNKQSTTPHSSSVLRRSWDTPHGILTQYDRLRESNERGANIYFGVNPRNRRGGTKESVSCCRCVWADLDHVTIDEALRRCAAIRLDPSIVVASGHGVHLYFLLQEPKLFPTDKDRLAWEGMLKNLYRDLASDSTQDVTRLLRLPGFDNCKAEPVQCAIVSCDSRRRLEHHDLERWIHGMGPTMLTTTDSMAATPICAGDAIRDVMRNIDGPTKDRSRRDFAIVCQLLRLGLLPEEIWLLVQDHSKFATDGRPYFETTIRNALDRRAD